MAFSFPNNDWLPFLEKESKKEYFCKLANSVDEEYARGTCYPPYHEIFSAFEYCSFANTKVVIIGQDPYINEGQAHGLSFSVKCKTLPPSLRNIYKEMHADLGIDIPKGGDLTALARQGVLLLNSSLTVRAGQSNAHKDLGWYYLTANVVAYLNRAPEPIVYILWGKFAQGYEQYINTDKHFVLKSAHPSPMSATSGFFGSKPFSRTNEILLANGRSPIDWSKAGE